MEMVILMEHKYLIRSVAQWPANSCGGWVLRMCIDYLKSKNVSAPESWLDDPSTVFDGNNAVFFVQEMMNPTNPNTTCESYADAWYEVLGMIKRVVG